MLYWLSGLAGELSVFNIFRYITFRTGGALITALLFVFLFGPSIIRSLRIRQGNQLIGAGGMLLADRRDADGHGHPGGPPERRGRGVAEILADSLHDLHGLLR